MKTLGKRLPYIICTVLALLAITLDISLLSIAGLIILTMSMGLVTYIYASAARKAKRAFINNDHKSNRSVDVSHENRVLPPVLGPSIAWLNDQGFRRLGEKATLNADGEEIGAEWVFVHAEGQITAHLVPVRTLPGGVLAGLQSIIPDDALQMTMYPTGFPRGETINMPDFRLCHTRHSLQAAYDLHCTELAAFAAQHGQPPAIRTMDDYMRFAPIYHDRYAGLILRRPLLMIEIAPWVYGAMTLVFLIATLLSGVVPVFTVLLLILGFSAMTLYLSYTVPLYPRAALVVRGAIVLLLVILLPLSFIQHVFVVVHGGLSGVVLLLAHRFIPAEAKVLADEIE